MKKSVFIALLAVLFLVACSSQKKKEVSEKPETEAVEASDTLSAMSDSTTMQADSVAMNTKDSVTME